MIEVLYVGLENGIDEVEGIHRLKFLVWVALIQLAHINF